MRIAMWSGPRNLSTAMMYAFGNRDDCAVSDEPFYAAYLARTGLDHPMRDAILASQPQDPVAVAKHCAGPIPGGRPHWYQKHMTHHILPGDDMGWTKGFKNILLIRHPARVIASYSAKRENPTLDDLGFSQQLALYRDWIAAGLTPLVIDSDDILADPEKAIQALCHALDLPFDPAMLAWPAGPRAQDGVWAAHWYGSVHKSTGFGPPPGALPEIENSDLYNQTIKIYEELRKAKNAVR